MKHQLHVLVVATIVTMASLTFATAQIPRTIGYQGLLTDGAGNFVSDGGHSLTLNIYDNIGASTPVFTEMQTVPVFRGIFNVIIGSVSTLPGTLTFDRAYYLGVSVDGGAEMTPRTAMTAVPYALHAAVADAIAPGASGVVTSVNGTAGAITLQGGGGTTVNQTGNTITITSSGAGGTGIQGVQNTDGSMTIANASGPVATLNVANGGITNSKMAPDAISTANILDGSVSAQDIGSGSASIGTVLTANGSGGVSWLTSGGGLTLPYTGTTSAITAVDVSTTSANIQAVALQGSISLVTPGSFGAGVKGSINSSSGQGFGVWGNHGGSGSGIYGVSQSGRGVMGVAYAGTGVFGNSLSGIAGVFSITSGTNTSEALNATTSGTGAAGVFATNNAANTSDILFASTIGTGKAGLFMITNSSSTSPALVGKTSSTDQAAVGVLGEVTNGSSGGANITAGVKGYVGGSGGNGSGVWGVHNASGNGVAGTAFNAGGTGVYASGAGYGVNSTSAGVAVNAVATGSGVGVKATASGTGTALELANGYLKVSGTNKTAFVHTISGSSPTSALSYPNPSTTDIVLVTPVWTSTYYQMTWGIYWTGSTWGIFSQDNVAGSGTVIPSGMKFNVLVIRQ